MKEKNQSMSRSKPPVYNEVFKRRVIEEYLDSGLSKMDIQRKYKILFKSAICTWMKQLGYTDIHGKIHYIEAVNRNEIMKKQVKQTIVETESTAILKKQIRELERALEDEKLRSEAYQLTIEIAEREFNIPIRKKRSTK
jgi:transposase-like protein